MRGFSIQEAIGFGWRTTWSHIGFFVVLTLIVIVLDGIPSAIASAVQRSSPGLYGLFELIAFVVETFLGVGVLKIALSFVDNRPASYGELFSGGSRFVDYLITSIILAIIVTIGFILLVIPGIYLILRFQFAPFLVVDEGLGPFAALARSSELTRGVKWKLLGFDLLLVLIELVGVIALLVGLLVTIPIVVLAMTHVYRRLLSQTGSGVAASQAL